MSPPDGRAPIEAIRHAAKLAVEADSLRSVAKQVRMSPTGLRQFLNGRAPYSATLRKLTAWFVKYQDARGGFDPGVARAAVSVLLEAIPEPERGGAAAELLEFAAELHRRRKVATPPWMDALLGRD
jgi:hypothetical protein